MYLCNLYYVIYRCKYMCLIDSVSLGTGSLSENLV